MIKASPVELRKSLDAANMLARAGIRFVPIPVRSEEEFHALTREFSRKLESMAVEAEVEANQ